MQQPNPWILFMGGIALCNVALLMGGIHAPLWVRVGGAVVCALLGVASMALGLRRYFEKKPERPKFVPKRKRQTRP